MTENTLKRARVVCEVVDAYYVKGRHDRSLNWVYRNIVCNIYPMSRTTFFKYIKIARSRARA